MTVFPAFQRVSTLVVSWLLKAHRRPPVFEPQRSSHCPGGQANGWLLGCNTFGGGIQHRRWHAPGRTL